MKHTKALILLSFLVCGFFFPVSARAVIEDFFIVGGVDNTATSSEDFTVEDINNLVTSDDGYYITVTDWPSGVSSFAEERYIEFIFQPNIPEDATINSVQITNEFRRDSALNGRKLEIWDGSSFVDYLLLNPPSSNTDITQVIDITEHVDNSSKVNNLKARFLAFKETSIAGSMKTRHDLVKLTIDYSLTEITPPVDTVAPVITLSGDSIVEIIQGIIYVDEGASAFDDVDGDITGNIVVTGLPVDTSVLGDHLITYEVVDAVGNIATPVTRTVRITTDEVVVLPSLPAAITSTDSPRVSGGSHNRVFFLPIVSPKTEGSLTILPVEIGGGQVLGENIFRFNNDLRRGSRLLPDVWELQKRLSEELYYSGPITGYFGPYTAMILRNYQQAHGLFVSGALDERTREELNGGRIVANPEITQKLSDLTI